MKYLIIDCYSFAHFYEVLMYFYLYVSYYFFPKTILIDKIASVNGISINISEQ